MREVEKERRGDHLSIRTIHVGEVKRERGGNLTAFVLKGKRN